MRHQKDKLCYDRFGSGFELTWLRLYYIFAEECDSDCEERMFHQCPCKVAISSIMERATDRTWS